MDRADPGWIVVSGLPGVGKTAAVVTAASDFPHVYHRAPPLPDPEQRAALAHTLDEHAGPEASGTSPEPLPGDSSWEDVFRAVARSGQPGHPAVLVVDDAHRWVQARSRFVRPLLHAQVEARREGRTLHVVLVSPEPLPVDAEGEREPTLHLHLEPLTFRAALPLLPGGSARERLQAYGVLGGIPGHLRALDPAATLATNVRRAVLEAGAPLAGRGLDVLEPWTQTPSRYAAILLTLSGGEADWSTVHQGVTDLTASGQVAPYIRRLEEMGLVEVRRSLDAAPRSRNRRYRITDPFFAFWYRHVLPNRHLEPFGTLPEVWGDSIRPDLDGLTNRCLAHVCRQYMAHDAVEQVGANARETGSLWSAAYDIPVAGMLRSGAAFYGSPLTDPQDASRSVAVLEAQVGETRYGFGRERRLKILFCLEPPPLVLAREAARRHDVEIVDVAALAGEN
jgi:hypothetical protein